MQFASCLLFFLIGNSLAQENNSNPGWDTNYEWPYCELGGSYSLIHKVYCDRYFTCQNGQAYLGQCKDGYGYIPNQGCELLYMVDCTKRPKLQAPQGTGECTRLYGLYATPVKGCDSFVKCDNGTAVSDQCALGLVFDDITKVCRLPMEEEAQSCFRPIQSKPDAPVGVSAPSNPTQVQGFSCPTGDLYPFGDHSRHPYPDNCKLFIMCLKDGTLKVGGCGTEAVYSPITYNCELPNKVPGCEKKK